MPTEANIVGGHKATLHNANTSAEAKEHSKQILEDEHNLIVDGNQVKDRDHVAAGLKGAMHNGQLSEDSQFAAAKKLGEVEK